MIATAGYGSTPRARAGHWPRGAKTVIGLCDLEARHGTGQRPRGGWNRDASLGLEPHWGVCHTLKDLSRCRGECCSVAGVRVLSPESSAK